MKQFENHTPRPWGWDKDYWGNCEDLIGPNNAPVAKAEDYYIDVNEPDAELLAAAPDLLADRDHLWRALTEAIEELEDRQPFVEPSPRRERYKRWLDGLRAALKGDSNGR